MAGMTTFFSDKVLNMLAAGTFPTVADVPGTLYVALLTTNPSDDSMTGAVEATYTNYVRASIVSTSTGWNAPSGTSPRQISNKLSLSFGTAGSGATITGFAICVHSSAGGGAVTTAGEVLYWNSLTGGNQTVAATNPVTAAAGAIVITQD